MFKRIKAIFGVWSVLVFPVAVALGILISLFLVVKPMFGRLIADQQILAKDQTRLDFVSNKITQLKRLDTELVAQRLTLIEKIIPSTKDSISGLELISQVARERGVSLDSLTVAPGMISTGSGAVTDDLTRGLSFQIAASGPRAAVLGFLEAFSHPTLPLIIPRQVALSYQGEKIILTATLAMVWKPVPDKFGGEDKPVEVLSASEENLLGSLKKYEVVGPTEEVSSGSGLVRNTLF